LAPPPLSTTPTFCRWAEAQGGDASVLRDLSLLPQAAHVRPIYADRSGWITHMDAKQVGEASVVLGAGRVKKGDPIDHAAGIVLAKKTGDAVSAGSVLAWLHTNRPDTLDAAQQQVLSALTIGEEQPAPQTLICGLGR
ncbi:MAG: pyrimidine-nucleoside phosphorylase, partial [Clostridiales bacterium]|nr:pyrimidine-nucleoside phosphorylase [Clostridiales bacterium]